MRPRLYYQHARGMNWSVEGCSRLRIIYPNGDVDWMPLYYGNDNFQNAHGLVVGDFAANIWLTRKRAWSCCWRYEWTINMTQARAIKLMHLYDESNYFKRAEFLGEL